MSDNNAVPSSEVVLPMDEKTQENSAPVVESPKISLASLLADFEAIKAALPAKAKEQKEKLDSMHAAFLAIESAEENARFITTAKALGIYATTANTAEVERLEFEIKNAKTALTNAGFPEDSPIVKGAIKGLSDTLAKEKGKVKDNLDECAKFLGVKVGKSPRVTEANGQLAMHRPGLAELKANDWYYKEGENTGIIVHSMSISENALAGLGIKPASDTWVIFSYNGELQVNREKDSEGTRYMAELTQIPENWLGAKPLNFINLDKLTLSGFIGKVAQSYGKQYHGNGWQGAAQLAEQFSGIERVVREA